MDAVAISFLLIQAAVGLTFAAHGAQKVFGWWGGPGLEGWEGAMQHMGFRPARAFALTSAFVELAGGILLAIGLLSPLAAAVLVAQSVVIIGHVHWPNGFFSSRSGIEFPLLLGVGAAAIALGGAGALSVDALLGLTFEPSTRVVFLVAGIVAGLVTLAIPRLATPKPAPNA